MPIARSILAGVAILVLPGAAFAEVPSVVASIKPVHSLVASVMQGVGEPSLLLDANASPHTYALRPSDAARLEEADLIFWIGPGVESFLDGPLENLASETAVVKLSETDGLTLLPLREGGAFEAHDHGHAEGGGAEDDPHEHSTEAHADGEHEHNEEEHDGEGHAGHEEHGEHAHDGMDPHVWLDPANAARIAEAIAERLAEADPDNAEAYRSNAVALADRMETLKSEISAQMQPFAGRPFLVFHDAFQYFENAAGVSAGGSLTVSPEVTPGARRVSELQARIEETGTVCLIAEPQFPRQMFDLLANNNTRTGFMDEVGIAIDPGPDLYETLMRSNAEALAGCLADPA